MELSGKSQDDVVSLLRNVDVGNVVTLTLSRQTSTDQTTTKDEAESAASTTAAPVIGKCHIPLHDHGPDPTRQSPRTCRRPALNQRTSSESRAWWNLDITEQLVLAN